MSVQSRQGVRDELARLLALHLTTAQRVYPLTNTAGDRITQPADFGGESPVVVVGSAGSIRDGQPTQRTFGGPVAPKFALDVYTFVATLEKDDQGDDVQNGDVDDEIDTLEAAVAEVVAQYPRTAYWTAIGYSGPTETGFVTVLDGSEYKRERIPLVITGS